MGTNGVNGVQIWRRAAERWSAQKVGKFNIPSKISHLMDSQSGGFDYSDYVFGTPYRLKYLHKKIFIKRLADAVDWTKYWMEHGSGGKAVLDANKWTAEAQDRLFWSGNNRGRVNFWQITYRAVSRKNPKRLDRMVSPPLFREDFFGP